MRGYYLLIIGAFIITFKINAQENKQNLLKEVISFYDVIPKEVVYKNNDLKVVLTEEYDEYSRINESYEFDPNTGKKNGAFVNKPFLPLYDEGFRNGPNSYDFENHTNEGTYNNGKLNSENYIYLLNEEYFLQGKIVDGHLDGAVSFYRIDEGVGLRTNPELYVPELIALKLMNGVKIDYYIKVGNGQFSKTKVAEVNYSKGTIVDGNYDLDNLTTVQYKDGLLNGVIRRNKEDPNIVKDSLFRENDIWKINNKYVKGATHFKGPSFDPVHYFSAQYSTKNMEIKEVDQMDYDRNNYSTNEVEIFFNGYDNYKNDSHYFYFTNNDVKKNSKPEVSPLFFGIDFFRKNKLNEDGMFLDYDLDNIRTLYSALFGGGVRPFLYLMLDNFKSSSFRVTNNRTGDPNSKFPFFSIKTSYGSPSEGFSQIDKRRYFEYISFLTNLDKEVLISVFVPISEKESMYVPLQRIFSRNNKQYLDSKSTSQFFEIAEFRNLKKFKDVPAMSTNLGDYETYGIPDYYHKKDILKLWDEIFKEELKWELENVEVYFERYWPAAQRGGTSNDLEGKLPITVYIDENGYVKLEKVNADLSDNFVKDYSSAISMFCRRFLPPYKNGKYVKSSNILVEVRFYKNGMRGAGL